MKLFLDTNVLIAASLAEHEHHGRAVPVLQSIHARKHSGCVSAHSLLEMYAILTRLPRVPRLNALQANNLIEENVSQHFTSVALLPREYEALVKRLGRWGITGGQSYDALHLACAEKCRADYFYTFNVSHFENLVGTEKPVPIVAP
jgi:predicted nucleic acid-binding protein